MDEQAIQERRRDQEEQATQKRAGIIGLQYLDTREFEDDFSLLRDILTIDEMYKGRLVPLAIDENTMVYRFGVTSQTPQSLIAQITQEYRDVGRIAQFMLISGSAFRVIMLRFDPPKKVVYDDIEIAKDGDSETMTEVSRVLASVGSDDIIREVLFPYFTEKIFVFVCASMERFILLRN